MARKKQIPKSKLSDIIPNRGPGMFTDERAYRSIVNAQRAIKDFLRELSTSQIAIDRQEARELRRQLKEIIRCYWSDYDHDQRVTYADMKKDFKPLLLRSARLQHAIKILPKPTKIALNELMSRKPGFYTDRTDHLSEILDDLNMLDKACKPIIDKKYEKKSGDSLEKAISKLWDLWEASTKKFLNRNWELAETSDALVGIRGRYSFKTPDNLFIQVVLQAVDPHLAAVTIRVRLKRVARTKPKSK